ncbi:MAG: MBL fold metallo-hydrolase [Kofleriaceae bacterium]
MTPSDHPAPLRVVFAPVATGDAVFIDTGARLYLIDCGAGLDYARAVEALRHRHLAGLVLTHAHADHWLALPEAMKQLAPDAWIARPGTTLAPALMRNQSLFEFYDRPVDIGRLIDAWDAIPPRALADVAGQPLWDVNATDSGPPAELPQPDWERVHCACITPAIRWAGRTGVFGADLAGAQWQRIASALPAGIDLLQAPNHGGPPGRMARWVLDDHLRPGVVVVTDAQPIVDDHLEWYSGNGRAVHTLQDRRTIVVTLAEDGVSVDVGGLELPTADT